MNRNIKIAVLAASIGLPLMVFFQNCGKNQSFEMVGVSSASIGTLPVDSGLGNELPPENLPAENPPVKNPPVVLEPVESEPDEILQAQQACDELEKMSESNDMNIKELVSEDNKSIYGIKGNHVISSKVFNGNSEIDLVDGVSGKLTVCGMTVGKIANTNGAVILVNSRVSECVNHHGNLQLVGNSSCDQIIDSNIKEAK